MRLTLPARTALARTPTPLEPLRRIGAQAGLDLHVKRDDLTGAALSGNKVRKLEFLVADALAAEADVLITCGAVTSNHARATAVAAARVGLGAHLILRGEEPDLPDGNLVLDRLVGAHTTFITPEQWVDRNRLMADLAEDLRASGRRPYVIPEGGSNALGALGYAAAAQELLEQAEVQGVDVRRIVHATGSGGTTAGLALGLAALGRDDVDVLAVAVCDDATYFDGVIGRILDDVARAGFASPAVRAAARWRIVEGYKGRGYALTTNEEMADYARVAAAEGLILDPVYTGKAFRALLSGPLSAEVAAGAGATVFLHTGGIFGLFSFARAVPRPDPGSAPRAS